MRAFGASPVTTWGPLSGAATGRTSRQVSRDGTFADLLARYRLGSFSPATVASPASPAQPARTAAAPKPASVEPTARTTPAAEPSPHGRAMALADFPRPSGDNGRGMHWVPTVWSPDNVVDRFTDEAQKMGVKWMVLLNDGTKIGDNDYLVDRLVQKGMMPIMRIYTPAGRSITGDLEGLVRHYRQRGVQYFQLYNEPNLNVENPDGVPNVDRYADQWIAAARSVVAGGGLPGFGSLSPGGNFDDIEFLRRAFDAVKAKGQTSLLDHAWLSMHNYTLNHPLDYKKDSNAYLKFRWYDAIVREKLGRSMPIIGTEGGTFVGSHQDTTYPAVTQQQQVDMTLGAYDYLRRSHEPYYFAYTYWLIANEAGGGHDAGFSNHALFQPDSASPLVDALRRTAR